MSRFTEMNFIGFKFKLSTFKLKLIMNFRWFSFASEATSFGRVRLCFGTRSSLEKVGGMVHIGDRSSNVFLLIILLSIS
jgi:hypothetical protein